MKTIDACKSLYHRLGNRIGGYFTPPRRHAIAWTLAILCLLLGLFALIDRRIQAHLQNNARQQVDIQLKLIADALSQNINARFLLIDGLAAYIEAEYPVHPEDFFARAEVFSAGIYQSIPGIRNIALAPNGVMQFVYPFEENKAVLGYEPAKDARPYVRAEVQRAIETKQIVLSRPYELIQGGMGMIARKAVFIDGAYWGLVNLVIDLPSVLESSGISPPPQGLQVLLIDQSGVPFYGEESLRTSSAQRQTIALLEGEWQLFAMPEGGWEHVYRQELLTERLLGLAIVILISLIAYLFINHSERLAWLVDWRTQELNQSNARLLAELAQRAETEQALRHSNQNLFHVLESIEADICITRLDNYEILYMNEHMRQRFGEDLVGKICYEVFRGEERPCAHCTNARLLDEHGEPTGVIVWEGYSPIVKRWYHNADRAIRWHHGEYVRMQIATDITHLKQAEQDAQEYSARLEQEVAERTEKLRQAQEKLIRQEKLATLGELAASIGHELRNPLGVISNAVYYLRSIQSEANEKVLEYLDLMAAEISKANKIISALLDFARNRPAQRTLTSLSALIRDMAATVEVPANVHLEVHIDDKLPEIMVDRLQITQVLSNLITNACQAMPDGGRLAIIAEVEHDPHDDTGAPEAVLVRVVDSGVGIPEELREKIFEPLFTTKTHGIGLGLAICKLFIEANQGTIEVESTPGKGSTFTIRLPMISHREMEKP